MKTRQVPASGVPLRAHARVASVDGDADRLVYYFVDDNNAFHLLDGDRIATLSKSPSLRNSNYIHHSGSVETISRDVNKQYYNTNSTITASVLLSRPIDNSKE